MRKPTGVVLLGAFVVVVAAALATAQGSLTPEEALGRSIFFDEGLSIDQHQSCATCHAPEVSWVGPDSGVNAGPAICEGSITGPVW
jgi:cytochrome c peroxidase